MWHRDPRESSDLKTDAIAGGLAGITELCLMYPIDTVKTRMQSLENRKLGLVGTLVDMIKSEGMCRPMKGMGIIAATAGPAHAVYFASYQYVKNLIRENTKASMTTAISAAGTVATFMHDFVTNPAEVIKQRLQMKDSPYKSTFDCAFQILKNEGIRAFYKSYGTQLLLNIPFQVTHFVTYEWAKKKIKPENRDKVNVHLLNGAIAGGVAAGVTTPLDVVKTLLNTQQVRVRGFLEASKQIYNRAGPRGFFKGIVPRIVYQAPSNAICWAIYETVKAIMQPRKG